MSFFMDLLSTIVTGHNRFAAPQDKHAEVIDRYTDGCGRPVTIIRGNVRTINEVSEGTTYPGDVTRVHTKIGPGLWMEHYEDFRK
jgi:hypothetical protein